MANNGVTKMEKLVNLHRPLNPMASQTNILYIIDIAVVVLNSPRVFSPQSILLFLSVNLIHLWLLWLG